MKRKNKIISLIIAIALIVSMLPMSVLATESCNLSVSKDTNNWQKVKLEWNQVEGAEYTVLVDNNIVDLTPVSSDGKMKADYSVSKRGTHNFQVIASGDSSRVESNVANWNFVPVETLEKVTAYSTYNGIDLEWADLGEGIGYAIYEGEKKIAETSGNSYYVRIYDRKIHRYKVHVIVNGEEQLEYVTSNGKTKVLPIQYNLTFGSKCKLTCWTSGHKKHKKTFKKGQKLVAYEFRKGCYKYLENGHRYCIKRIRLKDVNAKGWYNSKKYYSSNEATRYVNRRKLTSKKNTLIFVSTKGQHIYLFKRSKGKWKIDHHWMVSTGSPNTPTPSGLFKIKYKWYIHNTLHYWSACSTFSIHSKNDSWKLGKPKSGGCVRNTKSHAKYIYYKYKCGTKVCVF